MRLLVTSILIVFVTVQVLPQKNEIERIYVMEIVKKNPKSVYLDDYCSKIEFVPLDEVNNAPVGIIVRLEACERFIYVLDHTKTLTIFTHEGTLINQLTPQGKGPGEIGQIRLFHILEELNKLIVYDDSNRKLIFFDLSGNFISEHRFGFSIDAMSNIDKRTTVLFTDGRSNSSEIPGHLISLMDTDKLEIYNTFNLNTKQQTPNSISFLKSRMARINGDVILQVPFCDTLFEINQQGYNAKYIFELEGTGLKPHMMKDQRTRRNAAQYTTQCSIPYMTSAFLIFKVDYQGKPTIIIKDQYTKKWNFITAPDYMKPGLKYRGIKGVTLPPLFCNADYYYSSISALDFKRKFSTKYPALTEKIDEEDNPVLVRGIIK